MLHASDGDPPVGCKSRSGEALRDHRELVAKPMGSINISPLPFNLRIQPFSSKRTCPSLSPNSRSTPTVDSLVTHRRSFLSLLNNASVHGSFIHTNGNCMVGRTKVIATVTEQVRINCLLARGKRSFLSYSFTGFKSRSTKRKRTDHDEMVTKRKIPASSADKNDSDDDSERLLLSPRVPPIVMKSSNTKSRPMQSTVRGSSRTAPIDCRRF